MARLDELEARDPRFERKPDGSMKETFPDGAGYTPTERSAARERFIKGIRTDIARWRDAGDEAAAQRGEIQISFQQAEWDSTHHSRRASEADLAMRRHARDKMPDAAQQQRQYMESAHERMLESDRASSLAHRKLDELNRLYESDRYVKQVEEGKRLEEIARRANEEYEHSRAQETRDHAPLRDQLDTREQERYDQTRARHDRFMERYQTEESRVLGKTYTSSNDAARRDFDAMYREDMSKRTAAREGGQAVPLPEREIATARGKEESSSAARSLAQTGQAREAVGRELQRPSRVGKSERERQAAIRGVKSQESQEPAPASQAPQAPQALVEPEVQAADTKREHAPLLRQHQGYKAEIADEGKYIGYRRESDGKMGFKDLGNRVAFPKDPSERNADDIRTALKHSEEKFGGRGFTIRGPKEFQEQAAREATRMGMGDRIRNQELKSVIDDERAKVAQEQTAKAIDDAKTGSSTGPQAKTDDTFPARVERRNGKASDDVQQRDVAKPSVPDDVQVRERSAAREDAQDQAKLKSKPVHDDGQDGTNDTKGDVKGDAEGKGNAVEPRHVGENAKTSSNPHDDPDAEKGRADERGDSQRQAEGDRPDDSDRQASSSGNKNATAKARPDSDSTSDSDSARAATQSSTRTPDSAAPRSKGNIQKPVFYDEVKGHSTSDSSAAKPDSVKSTGSSNRPRVR